MEYEFIEDYNAEYTKQVLIKFWAKYIIGKQPVINAYHIYNTLGCEKEHEGTYSKWNLTDGAWQSFIDNGGFPQSMWIYYDWENVWYNIYSDNDKMNKIKEALKTGDYFHIRCNPTLQVDRRILLNTIHSSASFSLMEKLLAKHKNNIYSVKFFSKKFQKEWVYEWKIDKVVIYLPDDKFEAVVEAINDVLNRAHRQITPFCRLAQVGDKDLYLGVAPEMSGTSFTLERTKDMIHFLTGERPGSLKPDLSEKIFILERIFKEYGTDKDGERFATDCYDSIIDRIKEWWKITPKPITKPNLKW